MALSACAYAAARPFGAGFCTDAVRGIKKHITIGLYLDPEGYGYFHFEYSLPSLNSEGYILVDDNYSSTKNIFFPMYNQVTKDSFLVSSHVLKTDQEAFCSYFSV